MKRLVCVSFVAGIIWALALVATARATGSGAGLVVRHGDGRIVFRYVEFNEPSITGLDLLKRSGLSLVTAPYPGLGEAVCAIDGEGCPAEDCFCKSYGSPSFYWNYYYIGSSGQWVRSPLGAANRLVKDGDVDGWSWTSGPPGLPSVTIGQIAAMFGVSREPTASPSPISPTPQAELTADVTPQYATATPVPSPRPTNTPQSRSQPTPVMSPTASPPPEPGTATPTVAAGAGPRSTPTSTPVLLATATHDTTSSQRNADDGTPYVVFALMVGIVSGLIGIVWWRRSTHG